MRVVHGPGPGGGPWTGGPCYVYTLKNEEVQEVKN